MGASRGRPLPHTLCFSSALKDLDNIGLAKKFVRVFLQDVTKSPKELFGQPNSI